MTTIDFVRTLIEHGFKEDWPNFVTHPYAKHMLWRPLKGATELPPCSSNVMRSRVLRAFDPVVAADVRMAS